jgi:FkbM family methyltransferase
MMPTTLTADSDVLRPGLWLRIKAHVPWRLRHVASGIERYFYTDRGVFVWLDDRRVRCAVDAAPVFVDQPDHVEERTLMRRVLDSLRPGDVFLDAGSHVGLYAIGAAMKVGAEGRVVAFEPTPETVRKMRRNVRLNRLDRQIEIREIALSSARGSAEFVTTGTSMMNSIFTGAPNGHRRIGGPERRITVPTAPLDEFFDPSRRHVAKIDTEGHELAVLRGAERLLASPAKIFVELHPWAWTSADQTWCELLAIGTRHRRTMRKLDGTELTAAEHTRIEMVRAD